MLPFGSESEGVQKKALTLFKRRLSYDSRRLACPTGTPDPARTLQSSRGRSLSPSPIESPAGWTMGDSFAALPIAFREGQRIVRGMKDVVRLLLIPFVEPPTEWWVAGDLMSGDWRPTLLAIGLLGLYAVVMAVPPLRDFFELALLRGWDYLALAAIAVAWALVQRILWRTQLFERLLSP